MGTGREEKEREGAWREAGVLNSRVKPPLWPIHEWNGTSGREWGRKQLWSVTFPTGVRARTLALALLYLRKASHVKIIHGAGRRALKRHARFENAAAAAITVGAVALSKFRLQHIACHVTWMTLAFPLYYIVASFDYVTCDATFFPLKRSRMSGACNLLSIIFTLGLSLIYGLYRHITQEFSTNFYTCVDFFKYYEKV